MSAAEVRLGTIAISKSHNPDVRAVAEMLVADCNDSLHKLMELRAARTIVRATPQATTVAHRDIWGAWRMRRTANDIPITEDHHRIVKRLSSQLDDQFDRRFINEMVREHREAINLFETQAHVSGKSALKTVPRNPESYSPEDLAKDLDIADFARDILPTLRLHLERAEALRRKLQKR